MITDNKTLADAQPGGMVRLGDRARVTMSEDDFANMVETVAGEHGEMLEDGGPYNGWCFSCEEMIDFSRGIITGWDWERRAQEYALSAQPSAGGQGTGVSISDSDRAVLQRLQDALPFSGINGWGKGVEVLERLLRDSLAARQPVRIYGCCAQPEGELHTAECPNMRHLAAHQPVESIPEWFELVIRDVCELDPEDPDAADTVCIRLLDLRMIMERHALPAQAVDLGQFRPFIVEARNNAYAFIETMRKAGRDSSDAREKAALTERLLDLIDSHAVGK